MNLLNYEINEGTLALIATNDQKTMILEDNDKYIVEKLPFNVIDYSCKYFGSSYEGRKEGTKNILNINYKVPIIVDNNRNIIFFPTNSPTSLDCSWISLKNIESIKENKYNTTTIRFINGVTLDVPISIRSIENQILRASRLDSIMQSRK